MSLPLPASFLWTNWLSGLHMNAQPISFGQGQTHPPDWQCWRQHLSWRAPPPLSVCGILKNRWQFSELSADCSHYKCLTRHFAATGKLPPHWAEVCTALCPLPFATLILNRLDMNWIYIVKSAILVFECFIFYFFVWYYIVSHRYW